MDRFLAAELDKEDWLEASRFIQSKLSAQVIEKAVEHMPQEIQAISGQEIGKKLKVRIQDLDEYAKAYYKLLAKYVDVVGSNESEYFDIIRKDDGSVEVSVYETHKNTESGQAKHRLYHRTFYPSETKEIRLYGLKGKDVFTVSGKSKKSITLRIIGGPGNDVINERSNVQHEGKATFIYEENTNAEVNPGEEGKQLHPWNRSLYNYDRTAFAYNTYFPTPYISYNQYNGIELSMGVQFTRQKFGKQTYHIKHHLRASATTRGNLVFNYAGRLHHVFSKWDVEVDGLYAYPDNYNFFFGIGNETHKDNALFTKDFYVTRYNTYQVATKLIRDFWKRSSFTVQAGYQRYEGVVDANTILSGREDVFGIQPLHMLEGEAKIDLDFRDNPSLPTKGMRLWLSHQNGLITHAKNQNYGITTAFAEHYSTIRGKFPLTFGLKAGGSDSYGTLPFYRMPSLGQLNDLRGFVRHRFTGNGKLFINSELRLQLLDAQTSIVPIKFGVKGFYDWGRVYVNNEKSSKWHTGYGGGIYLVPLNERFTCTASVAFSGEESAFLLISLGRTFR